MAMLVYDGDCGFCTRCASLVPRLRLRVAAVVPYQRADLRRLGLTTEQCSAAVQWVGDDGRSAAGHRAIARLMISSGPAWRLVGRLLLVRPMSWVAAAIYRVVAANRTHLPGGTPACDLSDPVS